jgi:hypothetical protein
VQPGKPNARSLRKWPAEMGRLRCYCGAGKGAPSDIGHFAVSQGHDLALSPNLRQRQANFTCRPDFEEMRERYAKRIQKLQDDSMRDYDSQVTQTSADGKKRNVIYVSDPKEGASALASAKNSATNEINYEISIELIQAKYACDTKFIKNSNEVLDSCVGKAEL